MAPRTKVAFSHGATSALGRVTEVGLIADSRGPQGWRLLGRYALVYTLAGRAGFRDRNGLTRELTAGDAVLLFPDVEHRYAPAPGQRWSELYLIFEGPVFDLWRRAGVLDPADPFRRAHPVERWASRLESVPDEPRRPSVARALIEVCRLQAVLAELWGRPAGTGASGPEADAIGAACALLEADHDRRVDLPALARSLGLSYETFRKAFARQVGLPPARFRLARQIDRACELMRRGGLSDKEIAARLGFYDEFHFSHRFKQVTGLSPRAFRRAQSATD